MTLRARAGVGSLRGARVFPAVRAALAAANKTSFRVVQYSVQNDHVHLIVEGDDQRGFRSGLHGLAVRVARAVNRVLGRTGALWGDRYHSRALPTPRQVRNALVYVLMNLRKHSKVPVATLDPCSSAPWFRGFHGRNGRALPAVARGQPPVAAPRTWLARDGWRRAGLIDVNAVPRASG